MFLERNVYFMENTKCTFYSTLGFEHCRILKTCDCDGCKFRKTAQELQDSIKKSEDILKSKGLKSIVKTNKNGKEYVTVVKR